MYIQFRRKDGNIKRLCDTLILVHVMIESTSRSRNEKKERKKKKQYMMYINFAVGNGRQKRK